MKTPKRKQATAPEAPMPPKEDASARGDANFCSIAEPTMLERAKRLMLHIEALECAHLEINDKLFGAGSSLSTYSFHADNVEEIVAEACTRVACLVGRAHTIAGRLGN
jgi:hypothetical protein